MQEDANGPPRHSPAMSTASANAMANARRTARRLPTSSCRAPAVHRCRRRPKLPAPSEPAGVAAVISYSFRITTRGIPARPHDPTRRRSRWRGACALAVGVALVQRQRAQQTYLAAEMGWWRAGTAYCNTVTEAQAARRVSVTAYSTRYTYSRAFACGLWPLASYTPRTRT
jgi:hypothetical protein